MKNSQQYLKDKGVVSRISFKKEPKHVVKLMADEKDSIQDDSGVTIEGVKYTVEENGEQKTFFTSSVGLIQALSEKNEGETVTIEMKSKKGLNGFVTYFEVTN